MNGSGLFVVILVAACVFPGAQACYDDVPVVSGPTILIAGGPFLMGCNESVDDQCAGDEFPFHEVSLSPYYADLTEVTVNAYGDCVSAGRCSPPSSDGTSCNWGVEGRSEFPVNCVTWTQAREYCAWAGKRLPTEAEWERAARGTDGRIYPWGNFEPTCEYAVMYSGTATGCETYESVAVCSRSPKGDSPDGLCDMAGNVWEWVADWYDAGYYADSPASNPAGPSSGVSRVLRGGCAGSNDGLRVSARASGDEDFYAVNLGFRCAADLDE